MSKTCPRLERTAPTRSCPEEEQEGFITSALASSKLSVSQELLHTDKTANVSLVERQKPSLLDIVQEDQALLEQLQMSTSEKSFFAASISNISSSSTPSLSSSRVTYVLERSKNWGKEKEEVVELSGSYPKPLSTALTSIAVITNNNVRGRSHMTSSLRGGRGFPNDDD